jgi:ATP-dependent 26S proteasome regulatory subunit
VGGLESHIRCLKEMVVFPMLYREVFEKFHIQPPKGVLFHGPPGKITSSNDVWKKSD